MTNDDHGQVTGTAAEIYEQFFVPALFDNWTERVIDKVNVIAGQTVLDVACGTGILARTALKHVGATGSIIGVDINQGMLTVAQKTEPRIDWKQGVAESLPFEDNQFDAVVCQFGLMFFEDRQSAIQEMIRVLKPGKKLAVAVWDTLDNTPGYAAMVDLLLRLFGEEAANGLRAPYNLGDRINLQKLFDDSGIQNVEITTLEGKAHFPSLESWMYTDIKGWVLADKINDEQFAQLLTEAKTNLNKFVMPDGRVEFNAPAHIVTITK